MSPSRLNCAVWAAASTAAGSIFWWLVTVASMSPAALLNRSNHSSPEAVLIVATPTFWPGPCFASMNWLIALALVGRSDWAW